MSYLNFNLKKLSEALYTRMMCYNIKIKIKTLFDSSKPNIEECFRFALKHSFHCKEYSVMSHQRTVLICCL